MPSSYVIPVFSYLIPTIRFPKLPKKMVLSMVGAQGSILTDHSGVRTAVCDKEKLEILWCCTAITPVSNI